MGATSKYDLFCLGGAAIDLILRVPRLPANDDKLLTEYVGRQPGGLVANAACAAARLGLATGWAGAVGEDDFGREILTDFRRFGVDAGCAEVLAGKTSDFTVILLGQDGERTILVANSMPSPPALIPAVTAALERTRVAYSLPYDPEWCRGVAEIVHGVGGNLAVDVESSAPLQGPDLRAALKSCDMVFCSAGGLRAATGTDDPVEGVRIVAGIGVRTVVVTLGGRGAYGSTRGETVFVPARLVSVADTTGAGDCFHAAFLAGYLRQRPLEENLRFASAAAALSVQRVGARAGFPDEEAVRDFLQQDQAG